MTAAACALVGMAGLCAVADWIAVARSSKPLEYAAKPATLAFLVLAALAVRAGDDGQRAWFVVALVLSLAGDVFLMLPRDLFVAGLASFLFGHVAYIAGLQREVGSNRALVPAAAAVLIAAVFVGRVVVRSVRAHDGALVAPVVAYITVISAMVTTALATGDEVAALAAVVFYTSDALIAWNRFVAPRRWMPLAIIVTYHLAQGAFVVSLTR